MKKIVLTGGGSAGHVTPNLALIPKLKQEGFEISYIGSFTGIEKDLLEKEGIPYYGISTGKLRRYFDTKNFTDPFRVLKGYFDAKKIMKQIKPDIVFSKGGFVSVPVVRAANSLHIPCIIHESDMTPGLANKLCIPVAKKVCCNFPETLEGVPAEKGVHIGCPIREDLLQGIADKGRELCGFDSEKPIMMVIGGSLGASSVNKSVREALPKLLEHFQIIHICGREKIDNLFLTTPGYKQFEYVNEELKHLFAAADIVVSRAGANAICELVALKKPNLLIPLSLAASRGDQILNAKSFEAQGLSMVLNEDDLIDSVLVEKVIELYERRQEFVDKMGESNQGQAVDKLIELIKETAL